MLLFQMRKAWFSGKLFSPASKKSQNLLFLNSSVSQEDTNELLDNTSLSSPKPVDSGPILQKTTCGGQNEANHLSILWFFFLFSWLREHLSSPYRPSSHLMLTKDIEGDTQTHTRDVPHQKCAEECACCFSALDTSSRGFVKCLFSFAIHFVLCTTGKEMPLMLQRKLIQFPTFTQTNLEKDPFWNLDAEKSQ